METFDVQIDRWIAQTKGRVREFCVEFIQDLNEAIVRATPVKTGFLRASWYASIDQPGAGSGGGVAQMNLVASQLAPGQTYYMQNGAKYAMRVEYGFVGTDSLGRFYNQAPRAFVRGTLARADTIAAAAAARVAELP